MLTQTNASTFGDLQIVTCFAIAHALRHSATHLLECSVLGSAICCAACHETAERDYWEGTLLESKLSVMKPCG